MGPNGAGKTTTIRILSTLLTLTAGTARVQGFDVVADPREVRRRLGLAMQTPTLDAFSTGRETLKGTYSGGMKRRLDLASGLVHSPHLLILDEPTEALDPQSRTALWEKLERISAQGTTMLLTTHHMEEADRLCTRPAIIDSGQIVVEGTPADLKRTRSAFDLGPAPSLAIDTSEPLVGLPPEEPAPWCVGSSGTAFS